MEKIEEQQMKQEEKVTIEIDDDKVEIEDTEVVGPIKEIRVNLSTGQINTASEITDLLNGTLENVIIKSSKQCAIEISLFNYPEIVLFSDISFSGTKLLPLRNLTISPKHEFYNFQNSNWVLNDNIRCEISGVPDTDVEIIFRYC